jgi:hypothetical protein
MWSTILPELMSITVFILTILCLQAGHSPSHLQSYAILSLNTTGLKDSYHQHTGAGLPIHDVYNLYMMTTCSGYYANNSVPPLAGVTCSPVSWYCASLSPPFPFFTLYPRANTLEAKFLPATLIQTDLTAHSATSNLSSLSFPSGIQDAFNERFNLQLHVAFIFYVIALIWVGIVVVWGLLACWVGALGSFAILFTSVSTPPSSPRACEVARE